MRVAAEAPIRQWVLSGRFASETRVDFWGDGTSLLPLVLVDEVADALVRAMEAPGIGGQTLLLTSPPLMNAREHVDEVAAHIATRIDARPRPACAIGPQIW
jgi:nucleoside-diphosphate-sugar epimerase